MTGSNASVPSAWDKALKLLASGQVQTAPLITDRFVITEWESAFEAFNAKQGIKTLLKPVLGIIGYLADGFTCRSW